MEQASRMFLQSEKLISLIQRQVLALIEYLRSDLFSQRPPVAFALPWSPASVEGAEMP